MPITNASLIPDLRLATASDAALRANHGYMSLVLPLTLSTPVPFGTISFLVCVHLAKITVTIQIFVLLIVMFVRLTASLLLLCRSVQEGVLSRGTLSAVTVK